MMQTAVLSLSGCQFVEGRDREPETEGHWCCDGRQTQAGGETEGGGQRKEGEWNAMGDESECVYVHAHVEEKCAVRNNEIEIWLW